MENFICMIFVIIVLLFSALPSTGYSAEVQIPFPKSETFARLDGGKTSVTQNGFSLCFSDAETGETSEIFLKSNIIKKPGKCSFSNKFIFFPGERAVVAFDEQGTTISGCCLYNRDGDLLKEFLPNETTIKHILPIEGTFFIGDRLILIRTSKQELIYNIHTDEIKSTQKGAFYYPFSVQVLLLPESIFFRRFFIASDFASISPARMSARFVSIGPTNS